MQPIQGFKFELLPTGGQQRDMRRFAGSRRLVYNKALALQIECHEKGEKNLSYVASAKELTGWRNGTKTPWLADAPIHALQQAPKDLGLAFVSFFERRADFPTFKKRGPGDSFRAVGIDMGVTRFGAFSDGSHVKPLHSFKRHEDALAKAQCRLSHKAKFSNNWKKEKSKVQKIYARIANVRSDFLHKITTAISKNQALVFVEDLRVGNMSKSAAGTSDAPGRNVRAKSGLNKAILDQGWYEFRRQLDYKLAWNGGYLIAVPPQNTSQECPQCHHVSPDNRRSQARFCCVACGFEANADHVGAINVLSRGTKILQNEGQDMADASARRETAARIACEVSGARGRQQQEPTEETAHE